MSDKNTIEESLVLSDSYKKNVEISRAAFSNINASFDAEKKRYNETDRYPDYYGGSYIDKSGTLVILVKGNIDNAFEDINARAKITTVNIATCQYSYNMLSKAMEEINTYLLENGDSCISRNIRYAGLYDKRNNVTVGFKELTQENIDLFRQYVSELECIEFEKADELRKDADINCGDGITDIGGYIGTVGYRARPKDSDNEEGFVTGGHVITAAIGNNSRVYYKGVLCAQCTARQYGASVDAAYCKIIDNSYTPTNNLGSGTLSTDIDNLSVGDTVFMRGVYNHSSGIIESTNVTVKYDNGHTLTNLVQADYPRQNGDSGGVVYAYYYTSGRRVTVGIHSGGDDKQMCAYYCKASLANSTLGIERY